MNVLTFPLVDGPRCETREALIQRMAADLIRFDAFRNRDDAVRSLMWRKDYSAFLVMRFADEARQIAVQDTLVAAEMAKS